MITALKESWNGQQAAIFTNSSEAAAKLVDPLVRHPRAPPPRESTGFIGRIATACSACYSALCRLLLTHARLPPSTPKQGSIVGRININVACGRSPDALPFSVRHATPRRRRPKACRPRHAAATTTATRAADRSTDSLRPRLRLARWLAPAHRGTHY